MPYQIVRHGNSFHVINPITGLVHARHTTLNKAKGQVRLLTSLIRPMKHRK
jgi:hypothetical protein